MNRLSERSAIDVAAVDRDTARIQGPLATVVYLIKSGDDGLEDDGLEYVALGRKKRGFAENVLNGPGGKVEDHEPVSQAMAREANEEWGISIDPLQIALIGILEYLNLTVEGIEERTFTVIYGSVRYWDGKPAESEEFGEPAWYRLNELPYGSMHYDDAHWLPGALSGNVVFAKSLLLFPEAHLSIDGVDTADIPFHRLGPKAFTIVEPSYFGLSISNNTS